MLYIDTLTPSVMWRTSMPAASNSASNEKLQPIVNYSAINDRASGNTK
ncbi:hypothetical protein [Limosilactobacillus fermentum]